MSLFENTASQPCCKWNCVCRRQNTWNPMTWFERGQGLFLILGLSSVLSIWFFGRATGSLVELPVHQESYFLGGSLTGSLGGLLFGSPPRLVLQENCFSRQGLWGKKSVSAQPLPKQKTLLSPLQKSTNKRPGTKERTIVGCATNPT